MRNRYLLPIITVSILINLLLAWQVWAGSPDSPGAPNATNSYTLQDLYNRLTTGAAGTQSIFTEPSTAPGAGTMHTLNEIMAKAPALDNTTGATTTQVLVGRTFWGLTGSQWGVITGTMPNAGVPKTGQTTSYVSRDDGDLERGVAWPNPRFTNNSDGTVMDNLTGLIWLRNANCPNALRNWSTALSDVAQLNTNGQMNGNNCGDISNGGSHQTDWRLPNVRELHSLVDYGYYNPALPSGHPFIGVQSAFYWSSSTTVSSMSNAWNVFMSTGFVFGYDKANAYSVWPVRGGE